VNTSIFFSIAAILIGFVNYYTYLRSIVRGETHPHLFSWLIWFVTGAVASYAQIAGGAGIGALPPVISLIYFLVVIALCPRFGYLKHSRFDWICLVFSLLAVPLWIVSKSPLLSVILVTAIDGIGFLPTIRKTWDLPYSENLASYCWGGVRLFVSLLALENFTAVTALFQASFLLLIVVFVGVTLLRRRYISIGRSSKAI